MTISNFRYNITLALRTAAASGLIYYAADDPRVNLLTLFIRDGKPVMVFNLGTGNLRLEPHDGRTINDLRWHTVNMKLQRLKSSDRQVMYFQNEILFINIVLDWVLGLVARHDQVTDIDFGVVNHRRRNRVLFRAGVVEDSCSGKGTPFPIGVGDLFFFFGGGGLQPP